MMPNLYTVVHIDHQPPRIYLGIHGIHGIHEKSIGKDLIRCHTGQEVLAEALLEGDAVAEARLSVADIRLHIIADIVLLELLRELRDVPGFSMRQPAHI